MDDNRINRRHRGTSGCVADVNSPSGWVSFSRYITQWRPDVAGLTIPFIAGVFLTLLIFLSVAGNILVCIAIYTERSLRRIGNLFLASLAIADLFVASLVMTFAGVNDLLGKISWCLSIRHLFLFISCTPHPLFAIRIQFISHLSIYSLKYSNVF